jgi:hypothetical protein
MKLKCTPETSYEIVSTISSVVVAMIIFGSFCVTHPPLVRAGAFILLAASIPIAVFGAFVWKTRRRPGE